MLFANLTTTRANASSLAGPPLASGQGCARYRYDHNGTHNYNGYNDCSGSSDDESVSASAGMSPLSESCDTCE